MAFPGYNPFLASSSYLPSFSAGGAFSSPYGAAGAASGYSFPSAATYSAPTLGGYPFGGASASSAFGSFGSYGAPSSYGSYSPVAQSGFSGLFPTAPTVTSSAYGASAYGSTYTPGASPFLLGGPKGGAPTAAPAAPTAPTYGQYAPTATHGAAAYPYAGAYGGFPGAFGATATHYNPHFAGAAAYGAAGAYGSPYGQRYPFAAAPGPINPYHQPRHVAPQPAAVPIRRSEYKNDDYYSDTSSNYSGYSGYYSN